MSELVSQALDLVLYGMGTVFAFLTILVAVTLLMSYLINLNQVADVQASTGSTDPKILAAISAAVKLHRQNEITKGL